MGLITGLLTLPLAPLRGVVLAAEQVQKQAEDELYDPARIRAQLEEVERQRQDGRLSEADAEAWEEELVERLLVSRDRLEGRRG